MWIKTETVVALRLAHKLNDLGLPEMHEPIHIISLGAGVQSSTMALMAAHGEITPMPKCAIFADTQAEPKTVYEWLNWLEKQLPFPVLRISYGDLTKEILGVHVRRDGKGFSSRKGIPAYTTNVKDGSKGIMPRQCTYSYKVEPLDKEERNQVGVPVMKKWRLKHKNALKELSLYEKWLKQWKRYKKANAPNPLGPRPIRPEWAWNECMADPLCVVLMGISLDEVSRMKQPRKPWQNFRYPLVDLRMSRFDCLLWMKSRNYPEPPRSACVYCPYHSDKEWIRLRDEEPESFAEAVRVDKEYRETKSKILGMNSIPFLHNSRVPLDQVDFSTDEDHGQQVMFGNECEGMCGV